MAQPPMAMGTAPQPARLLTTGATTGWLDWIHGELWLLPHGLLRIPLGLGATLLHGLEPTVNPGERETQWLDQQTFSALVTHRKNLWIPRAAITRASLHHGLMVDRLRLELSGGRSAKLLWLPCDQALQPLQHILGHWLGKGLVMD